MGRHTPASWMQKKLTIAVKLIATKNTAISFMVTQKQGKKDFVKYALLQSKQYQNIPRTIQNVFFKQQAGSGIHKADHHHVAK
jgi:hypothetical protein